VKERLQQFASVANSIFLLLVEDFPTHLLIFAFVRVLRYDGLSRTLPVRNIHSFIHSLYRNRKYRNAMNRYAKTQHTQNNTPVLTVLRVRFYKNNINNNNRPNKL